MPDNNFVENARRGKIGEKFVIDHINSLCASLMLNQEEHSGDYIEGGDLRTHMLRVGQEINSFLPDYVDMPELQEGTWYEVCGYTIGGVEVAKRLACLIYEELIFTMPFAVQNEIAWGTVVMRKTMCQGTKQIVKVIIHRGIVFLLGCG